LHIAVEATCWHNRRGYGRHARALFPELVRQAPQHTFTFVTDGDPAGIEMPPGAAVRVVQNGAASADALRAGGRRALPDLWRMSRALSSRAFDAVVFPSIFSYVPVLSRARKIVFQHDAIPETFPHLAMGSPARQWFWRMKCAAAHWQAGCLVTVSDYSREQLTRRLGWPASRIDVVGEAPSPVFRRHPDPELTPRLRECGIDWDHRMVVFVGGFSPHKNLGELIRAFAEVSRAADFADLKLVMVGETENETFVSCLAELRELCAQVQVSDRVIFTGYLPDEDLSILLSRASVLALPSLMEGFGLPAVEAAACGCPVIATTESPLRGLLGDAGIHVDPHDRAGWEQALRRVAGDPGLRERMRAEGLARARALRWDAHARVLLSIIEGTASPVTTLNFSREKNKSCQPT
jgi:glycosyltransferase involved in cell wall biosynthesis